MSELVADFSPVFVLVAQAAGAAGMGVAAIVGLWGLAGGRFPAEAVESLTTADAGAFHHYRLMNLKKIYPYVGERLNAVLMRFSGGAEDYYWTVSELMEDLREAVTDVPADRSN